MDRVFQVNPRLDPGQLALTYLIKDVSNMTTVMSSFSEIIALKLRVENTQ